MESSTAFEFSTGAAGKLTVVSFVESGLGKDGVIKLDGNNVTLDKSGVTTVDLAAGNHKIQKNTTKTHIYYLAVALEGGSSSETTTKDEGSEATTSEAPVETTTLAQGEKIEVGEITTENTNSGKPAESSPKITYPKNDDGSYSINDADTALAGNLIFPFEPQSQGKVVISGTFTPGGTNSGWTLVQIIGKETADASELSDLFDFRAISDNDIKAGTGAVGTKGNYNLRIGETYKAGMDVSIAAAKTEYQFVIDLTNKTVKATIGGKSTEEISFGDAKIDSISGVKFMTASGERNISMTKPEVTVIKATGGDDDDTTTEATTTTTTEASTTTTEATTTTTTEASTETTEATTTTDAATTTTEATTTTTTEASTETTEATTTTTTEASTETTEATTTTDAAITTTEASPEVTTDEQKPSGNVSGDVDNKVGVSANDAATVLWAVIHQATGYVEKGDVNGNGILDADDAAQILLKVINPAKEYRKLQ